MGMKKSVILASILAVIIIVVLLLFQTKCTTTSMDPVIPKETAESSDDYPGLVYEDSFPPDTSPGMIDPLDFANDLLKSNPNITETELRVEMYKAGFFAYEIKATVEKVMPKTESSKTEESNEQSSGKDDHESTQEEESKSESQSQSGSQNQSSKTEQSSQSGQSSSSSSQSQESQSSQGSSSQSSQESSSQSQSSQQTQESKTETSTPAQQESQTSTCDHEWVDVTTTVHHDAVTEQVWVVDKEAWDEVKVIEEAWDEEVDTGEYQYQCLGCGATFAPDAFDDLAYHCAIEGSSYWSAPVYEYVHHDAVTETVHHEEEGHYETQTVTEAYDETVVTGQKCSKCGATK